MSDCCNINLNLDNNDVNLDLIISEQSCALELILGSSEACNIIMSLDGSGGGGGVVFKNFTFTATSGQTIFTLPSSPSVGAFIFVCINGTVQNRLANDFTVSGSTLTLSIGVDEGDVVYGIYQE